MAKRSTAQIERDRRNIANYYLQGWLQSDIADKLNLSQPTISRDISVLQEQWRESSLVDIDEKKAEELAKIDTLEREYWQAWKRSCEDAETVTQKAIDADGIKRREAQNVTKGQAGDPRFLAGVQWCINKRCEIIGIDAPKRHELTGAEGNELKIIVEYADSKNHAS